VGLILMIRRSLRRNAIPTFSLPTDPGAVSVYPIPPIPSIPRPMREEPKEHSDV
jgi:NADH-quinone oxidoreductase subunit H